MTSCRSYHPITFLLNCHKFSFLPQKCQEIGLVAFMFFFELLFSYVSSQFPSMFPLLTYSQTFFSLSADHPRHFKKKGKQDFDSTNTGNSLKSFYDLGIPQDSQTD